MAAHLEGSHSGRPSSRMTDVVRGLAESAADLGFSLLLMYEVWIVGVTLVRGSGLETNVYGSEVHLEVMDYG